MVICVVHLKQNCSHASWQGKLAFVSLPTALPPTTASPSLSPGDIIPTVTHLPPVTTTLPSLSPGAIAGIAVGTIVGLVMIVGILLLVFLCGVLVAGM